MAKPWRNIPRKGSPQREIDTIIQAAELMAPGCALTKSEVIEYLNGYAEDGKEKPRERLAELDKAALKIVGQHAL